MCDGTYQYPFKGGAAKSVPAVIIICGNKHPQELYPNAWQYIEARFKVVDLGKSKSVIPVMKQGVFTTKPVVLQNYRDRLRVSIAAIYGRVNTCYYAEYHCEYEEPGTDIELLDLSDEDLTFLN